MNLPDSFIERTKPLLKNEWDAFINSLNENPVVSVRINPSKLLDFHTKLNNVKWCENGYYLKERPSFTFDPLFHTGAYYVQEASSMFIERAVKQYIQGDVRFLDLCAAPGGKSSHIAGLLSKNSILVSNEVIRNRADILSENMIKSGFPNVIVTNNDPANIGKMNHFFDAILIDAPCSGEGMFRKDREAIREWSPANVQLCSERQRRIIADVWDALKPGGILIYSTCTYNREENENNVIWIKDFLGAEVLSLKTDPSWNISTAIDSDITVYRFFPHKTKGEGFFLSVLRKNDSNFSEKFKTSKIKDKQKKVPRLEDVYKRYIFEPEAYQFFCKGDTWYGFPSNRYMDFENIASNLKVVSAGICVGEYKGKDFIPAHSLAMSNQFNTTSFEKFELDWKTAISYLRKEALVLPDLPRGYILLIYDNIPLGFVKNIGNRANNLYPQEWRIRSGHIPESIVDFL